MPANLAPRFLVDLARVFGCLAMLSGIAASGEAHAVRITTAERSFTVETQRLRVTFADGMIVALENLQTGERHADAGLDDQEMYARVAEMFDPGTVLFPLHQSRARTDIALGDRKKPVAGAWCFVVGAWWFLIPAP